MGNFIWVDSCGDHYATADIATRYSSSTGYSVASGGGRLSSNAIEKSVSNNALSILKKTFTTQTNTLVVGFSLDFMGTFNTADRAILQFMNGATPQVTVMLTPSGKFSFRRGGATGVVIGTTTTDGIVASGHQHVEARVVFNDTTGSIEIKVNGVSLGAQTGLDTNNGASNQCDSIVIGGDGLGSALSMISFRIDDLFIHQDTFQGDLHFGVQAPNGNGDSSDFTGSDGNSTDNYLLVDESPGSETDYVESNTVGHKDLYHTTNLSFSSGTIPVVAVETFDRKTDAAATTFRHILKSSATTSNGASIGPTTTNGYHQTLFHTDPNGGGAHSVSSVNGYQIGVEILS